jgi:integrase
MVDLFLKYFKKPAEELGKQEIREYLYYLRNDRNLSPSTVNGCNSALRFFFEITLEKSLIYRRIPRLKDPIVLPNILTRDEVEAIFNATTNLKHKCILMTICASGLHSPKRLHSKSPILTVKICGFSFNKARAKRIGMSYSPKPILKFYGNIGKYTNPSTGSSKAWKKDLKYL